MKHRNTKVSCPFCGEQIEDFDTVCSCCGKSQLVDEITPQQHSIPEWGGVTLNEIISTKTISGKSKGVTLALCGTLGWFGVHRFYSGKVATGIVWLLTAGVFGVGAFVDFLMILCGSFKDKDGNYICDY